MSFSDQDSTFIKGSLLYRVFLAEKDEILRHKWIESEKVGYDIGFERALLDWVHHYRSQWRSQWQQKQHLHHDS